MNWKPGLLGIAILASIGFGIIYLGWHTRSSSEMHVCNICQRPIHAETRTVALIDGKETEFCCPACALSVHLQTGEAVHIKYFTDFMSHSPISPEGAFFVEGSRVNPCAQHDTMRNSEGQSMPVLFDRCSPSILAFGSRTQAQEFMYENGGKLVSAGDFISGFNMPGVRGMHSPPADFPIVPSESTQ